MVESYDKPTYMSASTKGTCFTQVGDNHPVDDLEYSGSWLTPTLRNLEALNGWLKAELPVGKQVSIATTPERSVMVVGPEPQPDPGRTKNGSRARHQFPPKVVASLAWPSCERTCLPGARAVDARKTSPVVKTCSVQVGDGCSRFSSDSKAVNANRPISP